MNFKTIFPQRLKEARTEAKISQASLAEFCGVNQSSISSFEKGTGTPNLEVAATIAERLGVSLGWLCGFGEKAQNVTPTQWLGFLDSLINNPPTVEHKPLVDLRLHTGNEAVAALEFYGDDMRKFFSAYLALMQAKKQIGDDVYESLIQTVFARFSNFFEPGYKMFTRGVDTFNPPHNGCDF